MRRLSIFDRFRKDEVVGTKVLVCALESVFFAQMNADAEVWRHHYPATNDVVLSGPDTLFQAIDTSYDVIHMFASINQNGTFLDSEVGGTELIRRCCASNVKLLWIASDNEPSGYITGFDSRGKRINLVMTLKRHEPKFTRFLDRLLEMMSSGLSMPNAWVRLCPQLPGSAHEDMPETIFSAGRGGVILR